MLECTSGPQFIPAQACEASLLPDRVKVTEIKIRKASINQTHGLPIQGSLDVLKDLVHKRMRGEIIPAESRQDAPPMAVSEVEASVLPALPPPPAPPIPAERAIAKKGHGPVPCEERCRELEEENRALVRIVARLQVENERLKASRV